MHARTKRSFDLTPALLVVAAGAVMGERAPAQTGFAGSEGEASGYRWAWEVKSVNSRSLDIRCRTPSFLDGLEAEARRLTGERFKRGSIQISLQIDKADQTPEMRVNRAALDQVLAAIAEVSEKVGAPPPRIETVLAIKGVLEVKEPEETSEDRAARAQALVGSLSLALEGLEAARRKEGEKLSCVLSGLLDEIDALTKRSAAAAAAQPEALRARLKAQIDELLGASPALPEERLAQEVAVLLVKSDIREELDRLVMHISAARDLLASAEPVGRKLDFLAQELNREANTLCSKAADGELKRIGLDLKAAIDQLREQVQNVE
ncbi:MAG: YicC/YloC family endoribonuclease [Pseudomonadota bacterium]